MSLYTILAPRKFFDTQPLFLTQLLETPVKPTRLLRLAAFPLSTTRTVFQASLHAVGAALMIAAQSAGAADYYWNGGSSSWSTSGSWLLAGGGAGAIPTALDTAHFSYSATGDTQTITLSSGTKNALGLVFESNHTEATVIESSSSSGRTLNLGSSGIVVNSGAGAVTIGDGSRDVDIAMQGAQSWTNHSANLLTIVNNVNKGGYALISNGSGNTSISGVISGTGGITKSGTGTLTLGGTNTFSGGLSIQNGTVVANVHGLFFYPS